MLGNIVGALLMASAIALIFTGPGLVAKKNWEYGGKPQRDVETRKDARGWFILILIIAAVIIFLNS